MMEVERVDLSSAIQNRICFLANPHYVIQPLASIHLANVQDGNRRQQIAGNPMKQLRTVVRCRKRRRRTQRHHDVGQRQPESKCLFLVPQGRRCTLHYLKVEDLS